MAEVKASLYQFGDFCLDPNRRVLLRGGEPVPLTPKALDTLLALVRRSGHALGKDELMNEVWPDTYVEESNLAQNIFTLRKALGQDRNGNRYIETVPKYGYRFVAAVRELKYESATVAAGKQVRTRIATQEVDGDAPADEATAARTFPALQIVRQNGRGLHKAAGHGAQVSTPAPGAHTQAAARPAAYIRRHWKVFALALLPVLGAALLLGRQIGVGQFNKAGVSSQNIRFTKLTDSGRVTRAAISPDGQYIAYAQTDGALQSLWLRQVTGTNSVRIVAPGAVRYQGVTFSPDGSSVYYVVYEQNSPVAALYQLPVLGGVAKKILTDIDSGITFSPDARRFAFLRDDPRTDKAALMVAGIDGTGEQQLAVHPSPSPNAVAGPAWSPDGKVIVCPVNIGDPYRNRMTLVAVRVSDGAETPVTSHQWDIVGQVVWLRDGSGVLTDAWDQTVSLLAKQIWQVSYPGGEARLLTNDLNAYQGVSLTTKANALVTVMIGRVAHFWLAPGGAFNKATQITFGSGDRLGEKLGLAWASTDKIAYGSTAGSAVGIRLMETDGSNQRQLTADHNLNSYPVVTPDGRTVVYVSRGTGSSHLWRMDIDGRNAAQLTNGSNEVAPAVSPDGQWVVYSSIDGDRVSLWRVAIDGSKMSRLTDKSVYNPSVSPDGKWIACLYQKDPTLPDLTLAVIPFAGGEPVKTFPLPPTTFAEAGLRWTPDGQALAYVNNQAGVSNIWSQSLTGGQPKQLTDFTSEQIFRFAWSPDGKQFIFERGAKITDAVLISDSDQSARTQAIAG